MSWVSKTLKKAAKAVKKVTPILGVNSLGIADKIVQPIKDMADNLTGKAARDAAKEQQEREIEYWKMQQEYNTPANQIARLKEAGLNPNLAYNSVTTGNASSAPNAVNVPSKYSGISNILGLCMQAVNLMNAQKSMKLAQADRLAQIEHSKDVLDFQRQQFAVNTAFREMEMSNGSHRWQAQFDETVRHNRAMEGKPTMSTLLSDMVTGFFGKSPTDISTDAGRLVNSVFDVSFKPVTHGISFYNSIKRNWSGLLRDLDKYSSGMKNIRY